MVGWWAEVSFEYLLFIAMILQHYNNINAFQMSFSVKLYNTRVFLKYKIFPNHICTSLVLHTI